MSEGIVNVEHFGGHAHADSVAALEQLLSTRFGADANEFWLSGRERFPALAIQVKGNLACVHYFPSEAHPGFVSQGELEMDNVVTFYTNTPDEEIEVPRETTVPLEAAMAAAREFFGRRAQPTSLNWLELYGQA